jgi:hypothetical protein
LVCWQAPALPGILAAAAIAMAGKEPRDIRVVWIRPVPGLAFIANEVGRRRDWQTVIEAQPLAHHPQADGAGTVLACEHGVVRPKGGGSARPNRSRRLVAVSGGRGADPGACGLSSRAKLRRSIKVDMSAAFSSSGRRRGRPDAQIPAAAGRQRPGVERSCGE